MLFFLFNLIFFFSTLTSRCPAHIHKENMNKVSSCINIWFPVKGFLPVYKLDLENITWKKQKNKQT